MKRIDLHTHSTFSDGTLTPQKLIEYASNKKLSAISITDHDTISGLNEAFEISKKFDIELITGVEFTCFISDMEVHILGYMFDKDSSILNEQIKKIAQSRKNRNDKMIEKFKDLGINIDYKDLLCGTNGNSITRSQFASALVKKGYAKTKDDAFDKYLKDGCSTYIKRKDIRATESIGLIKKAGGIAVLAHPLRYTKSILKISNIIDTLIPYGLDGVEAIYPTFTKDEIKSIKEICISKNLIVTGGSDFHGLARDNIDLGSGHNNDISVPYDLLNKMKKITNDFT